MSMTKDQINVGLFDRVKQLETELAAMTTERDSAFALLKTERDAFADMLAQRDAERAKCAKLRESLSNFTHGQLGGMVCICGTVDGDKCVATNAEETLEATK